jgi:hypothetical protein
MPDHSHAHAAARQLKATADELLAEVGRLPAELIHWIPGDQVWTVMDNLCHVREFVPFWTGEALRIVKRPEESWGRDHTDTNRKAAVTNTRALELANVVADIRRLVGESADTLETLTDADLATEATSKNPRWGRKPASFVVDDLIVQHVEKHLGQIRRNVAQFAERAARSQKSEE